MRLDLHISLTLFAWARRLYSSSGVFTPHFKGKSLRKPCSYPTSIQAWSAIPMYRNRLATKQSEVVQWAVKDYLLKWRLCQTEACSLSRLIMCKKHLETDQIPHCLLLKKKKKKKKKYPIVWHSRGYFTNVLQWRCNFPVKLTISIEPPTCPIFQSELG